MTVAVNLNCGPVLNFLKPLKNPSGLLAKYWWLNHSNLKAMGINETWLEKGPLDLRFEKLPLSNRKVE